MNNEKGFTLAEVLITLLLYALVMGMLMGIVLPMLKASDKYLNAESYQKIAGIVVSELTNRITYASKIVVAEEYEFVEPSDFADNSLIFLPDSDGLYPELYMFVPSYVQRKRADMTLKVSKLTDFSLTIEIILQDNNEKVVCSRLFSVEALNLKNSGTPISIDEDRLYEAPKIYIKLNE